jgi:hypothetical protein
MSKALMENDTEFNKILDSYAADITEAKYEKMDIDKVVENQKHLTEKQKKELTELLNNYTTLFNGNLGKYPHKKVHLEVDPRATAVYKRPYAVAHAHHETFKK